MAHPYCTSIAAIYDYAPCELTVKRVGTNQGSKGSKPINSSQRSAREDTSLAEEEGGPLMEGTPRDDQHNQKRSFQERR